MSATRLGNSHSVCFDGYMPDEVNEVSDIIRCEVCGKHYLITAFRGGRGRMEWISKRRAEKLLRQRGARLGIDQEDSNQ